MDPRGEDLIRLVLDMTPGWHPNMRKLFALADPGSCFPIDIRTSVPIAPWKSSNTTLLGDAIHTMTPGQGVGANTALRDAALLCRQLVAASIGGQLAGWSLLDYSAAKAAVIHLTRCVAVELGERGVRVNSVSPGPILTGLFGKAAGMDAAQADDGASVLEPVFVSRLQSWQPIHRAGAAGDVAPVLVWLASDAAVFVNGQNLAVDGGITAGRPASVSAADRAAWRRHSGRRVDDPVTAERSVSC